MVGHALVVPAGFVLAADVTTVGEIPVHQGVHGDIHEVILVPDGENERRAATLIFDEVDAGVGGVTAQRVAEKLKTLAGRYQVLCITHLPQIAAIADHHLRVEKLMTEGPVQVRVEALSGLARREELARMLSGRLTEGALRHAGELLRDPREGVV
jgi:DNA repair protein RecN (Recombination protein N)